MKPTSYRRRAILNRIHNALDAFYLLQKIDWEYDIRMTLDKIIATAMEEIEFEGGRHIERALLLIQGAKVGALEVGAGWRIEEEDLTFSHTVVQRAMEEGMPIRCENAKEDPRFLTAESLKGFSTLSLICVPIKLVDQVIGALYIESHSPGNIFGEEDLDFLQEFSQVIAPYLKVALVHQGHIHEIQKLRSEIDVRFGFENIVGRSEAMRSVFELIRIATSVDRTALVTGESGCGKELVARAIHYNSPRKRGPFVVVDCSGLAEHLLESELFGHAKGAFTGATDEKLGAFEEANGGTIFLDEISDAPKALQQKLRRVLQEGEIRRVGENQFRKVDVRVICATNRSLPDLVSRGEFMQDLYYRINKLPIHLPALRERREDIPPLVHHFIASSARENGKEAPSITAEAMELLVSLPWGANNARELKNVVELGVDLCSGKILDRDAIEAVLRIQKGEPVKPVGAFLLDTDHASGPGEGAQLPVQRSFASLVAINREAFLHMIKTGKGLELRSAAAPENMAASNHADEGGEAEDKDEGDKQDTPFYKIQRELAGKAILEGLRASGWKLRPAARLLGISPMKLRGELRAFIAAMVAQKGGDLRQASMDLEIPLEILQKKAGDFGLEGISL
ncbi:MAG: sigma 54-interacting transcriptional regulator [Planctomycetes bacterium]|nr:sigma 54-interacting transcriptional regulator [Planctomycetota bacterium]